MPPRARKSTKGAPKKPPKAPKRSPIWFLAPREAPKRPQEHPRGAQEAPKRPPRAPKRGPRDPQDALKTTFGSKTPIFQKSSCRLGGSLIFEDRRVILGAQNRPAAEECPRSMSLVAEACHWWPKYVIGPSRLSDSSIFEGRRVILGAQNRPAAEQRRRSMLLVAEVCHWWP